MKKKLSNEELITFCGQMALILKSGISSLEGIYIMEDGDAQTEGKEILKEIREELEMSCNGENRGFPRICTSYDGDRRTDRKTG